MAVIDIHALTQSTRERRWLGFVVGIVTLCFSLAVRFALGDAALKFPFVIFLPPVVITTFVGGLRPGIAAALLAGLLADVTLIAAPGTIVPSWPDGWLALGFYGVTVFTDIVLIHAMRTAFRRAGAAEAALRRANQELEQRVSDRTADLRAQIVEREQAEAQLRQMQKMESVGQLTGGIAHDFNNMLAVVIGSLELAKRRCDDPQRIGKYIDSAEEGARRASQLVTRLLAFSRQQPLEPKALDIRSLVAGMIELLGRTIGEQIRIETSCADDVWRCFADAVQLENAILNLAVNARDAMTGGGTLSIVTRNAVLGADYAARRPEVRPGDYVFIAVTDTGSGMPSDVMERAFDPFFTTKEVGKGTGLGLSQVYGFVRQSDGHLTLESAVGRGTAIGIYLPRHVEEIAAIEDPSPGLATPRADGEQIVLVVEDEPGVRLMSVDALRELGYTVVQAADGKAALGVLSEQPRVDALFTDVVMPGMDGRALAAAARELRPDLAVVFTTGYAPQGMLDEHDQEQRTAVLSKPFDLTQLATKMRDALERGKVGALADRGR